MRKDYIFSQYESIDFELNDCGTDEFNLRFDRMLNFLFADVQLYSNSARTIALSAADWEYYTQDLYYTAKEGESFGSGKTLYSQIKILNSTYQSGKIYGTCNNFGSYAGGHAQGPDYVEITSSTTYTIDPQIKEAVLLIPASVTTQMTITLEQGTHPCGNVSTLNRCRVVDESSYSGHHIVTDGTDQYWVGNQSVEFIFNSSGGLIWASAGWEILGESAGTTFINESTLIRTIPNKAKIQADISPTSTGNAYLANGQIDKSKSASFFHVLSTTYASYTTSTGRFATSTTDYKLLNIQLWHDPA